MRETKKQANVPSVWYMDVWIPGPRGRLRRVSKARKKTHLKNELDVRGLDCRGLTTKTRKIKKKLKVPPPTVKIQPLQTVQLKTKHLLKSDFKEEKRLKSNAVPNVQKKSERKQCSQSSSVKSKHGKEETLLKLDHGKKKDPGSSIQKKKHQREKQLPRNLNLKTSHLLNSHFKEENQLKHKINPNKILNITKRKSHKETKPAIFNIQKKQPQSKASKSELDVNQRKDVKELEQVNQDWFEAFQKSQHKKAKNRQKENTTLKYIAEINALPQYPIPIPDDIFDRIRIEFPQEKKTPQTKPCKEKKESKQKAQDAEWFKDVKHMAALLRVNMRAYYQLEKHVTRALLLRHSATETPWSVCGALQNSRSNLLQNRRDVAKPMQFCQLAQLLSQPQLHKEVMVLHKPKTRSLQKVSAKKEHGTSLMKIASKPSLVSKLYHKKAANQIKVSDLRRSSSLLCILTKDKLSRHSKKLVPVTETSVPSKLPRVLIPRAKRITEKPVETSLNTNATPKALLVLNQLEKSKSCRNYQFKSSLKVLENEAVKAAEGNNYDVYKKAEKGNKVASDVTSSERHEVVLSPSEENLRVTADVKKAAKALKVHEQVLFGTFSKIQTSSANTHTGVDMSTDIPSDASKKVHELQKILTKNTESKKRTNVSQVVEELLLTYIPSQATLDIQKLNAHSTKKCLDLHTQQELISSDTPAKSSVKKLPQLVLTSVSSQPSLEGRKLLMSAKDGDTPDSDDIKQRENLLEINQKAFDGTEQELKTIKILDKVKTNQNAAEQQGKLGSKNEVKRAEISQKVFEQREQELSSIQILDEIKTDQPTSKEDKSDKALPNKNKINKAEVLEKCLTKNGIMDANKIIDNMIIPHDTNKIKIQRTAVTEEEPELLRITVITDNNTIQTIIHKPIGTTPPTEGNSNIPTSLSSPAETQEHIKTSAREIKITSQPEIMVQLHKSEPQSAGSEKTNSQDNGLKTINIKFCKNSCSEKQQHHVTDDLKSLGPNSDSERQPGGKHLFNRLPLHFKRNRDVLILPIGTFWNAHPRSPVTCKYLARRAKSKYFTKKYRYETKEVHGLTGEKIKITRMIPEPDE